MAVERVASRSIGRSECVGERACVEAYRRSGGGGVLFIPLNDDVK